MFYLLGAIATALTFVMFLSKNSMLGFPCVIFWAIFGAYCFTQSTIPWGDIYFYMFFASAFGMTTFCALAAFGLREKKDAYGDLEVDEDSDEPEPTPIDETKADDPFSVSDNRQPSARTKKIRQRADKRRTGDY